MSEGKKSRAEVLELIVVILLGVTAILTAWVSWMGSMHSGNSAANYTKSNNIASEGNSEYNAGIQSLMQDMMLYNSINSLSIDLLFAQRQRNRVEIEKLEWKINELVSNNMSDELEVAYEWSIEEAEKRGESVSPFEKEGFMESYFATALGLLEESEVVLKQGQKDSANSDAYGLVTVIYSVVLFMLGITGTFKSEKNKLAIVVISGLAFLIATIYMFNIPSPTDFSLTSFFSGSSS